MALSPSFAAQSLAMLPFRALSIPIARCFFRLLRNRAWHSRGEPADRRRLRRKRGIVDRTRLFSDTAAMSLGIRIPSVRRPGVAAYPLTLSPMRQALSSGRATSRRQRQPLSPQPLPRSAPTRATASMRSIRLKTMRDFPGLADSIRRDLSMAMTESIDRAIFLGDAGATPNTQPTLPDCTTAGITELELTQADKSEIRRHVLGILAALIDGKYAASMADIRMVASVGSNTLWHDAPSPTRTATKLWRSVIAVEWRVGHG